MSRIHLTSLAAALALMAAPAFAQTNATTTSKSGADAGTSTSEETAPMPHGRTHAMHGYSGSRASAGHSRGERVMSGRASSADHSADQLNAQVLAGIQNGGSGASMGSGTGAGMSSGTGSMSNSGTNGTTGMSSGSGATGNTGAGSGSTGTQR